MRRVVLALVSFALIMPVPVHADHGGVHVAEILPSPGPGAREFVELWNDGPSIDLAGWTVRDAADTVYTFTNTTLPSGGRIVVWGGGVPDARGPAWSRSSVWNNGGDQVILRDASGATIDVFAYGSAAWPDGRNAAVPAAPATNRTLSLANGAWHDTTATPGTATSTGGGSATATVQNVAPNITLGAPSEVQAGAAVSLTLSVHDGNGDDDVVGWVLAADGTVVANGSAGDHTITLSAPIDRDHWQLMVNASDLTGAATVLDHRIDIRAAGLVIIMPAQGLAFPAFPPGATQVITNASFLLRNDGPDPLTPRIDISDLAGPATIPVAGRLDIGDATWTTYDGPLTALPTLQPGESVDLRLRLRDIPSPLPAGAYGTSFTVIA